MYEFRTESSRFFTDGTHWHSWEWKPRSDKDPIQLLAPFRESDAPFGSGNFLMFPWVNRHASTELSFNGKPFTFPGIQRDENGFPVHGLVHSLERKPIKIRPDGKGGEFRVIFPEEWRDSPISAIAIREEYFIEETSSGILLSLKTRFNNMKADSIRFAYGYHPYFSLGGHTEDWRVFLHLDKNLELDDKLVPIQPGISNSINSVIQDGKLSSLDHLFYGKDPRVVLENSKLKYSISVISPPPEEGQIALNYYQIYTKPDFSSIAIEPCSAPGNALVSGQGLSELKGYSEIWGECRILARVL
ncbi:aldose 1-epimerase [Leptospira wolffii]|uniref:Aldose 1-epimerase n=1 Tax=Leptospira wolffii TaxID=409998 RepID=A0ABV5BQ27_9LEPT